MATAEYRIKSVPVWAEQVPEDITSILDVATRWGADVRIPAEGPVTLTLTAGVAVGAKRSAIPGEWLIDRTGEGKGCCTNDEFVASFDPVAP